MRTHRNDETREDRPERLGRSPAAPATPQRAVLVLQAQAGNRAVSRALAQGTLPVVVQAAKVKGSTSRRGTKSLGVSGGGIRKPRRSWRLAAQTPGSTSRLAAQGYWDGPVFGGSSQRRGGSSVRAALGPAIGLPGTYGSGPIKGQCSAVETLNKAPRFLGKRWVKGHLLNDNLGGMGVSRNLTPMSHQSNMVFKGFESEVKGALQEARTYAGRDLANWYGVEMSVRVNRPGLYGGSLAARAIASSVTATAHWISQPRGGSGFAAVAPPAWTAKHLPVNVTVDCDL